MTLKISNPNQITLLKLQIFKNKAKESIIASTLLHTLLHCVQ